MSRELTGYQSAMKAWEKFTGIAKYLPEDSLTPEQRIWMREEQCSPEVMWALEVKKMSKIANSYSNSKRIRKRRNG